MKVASLSTGSRKLPVGCLLYCFRASHCHMKMVNLCFRICWPAHTQWPIGASSLAPIAANKQDPTCATLKSTSVQQTNKFRKALVFFYCFQGIFATSIFLESGSEMEINKLFYRFKMSHINLYIYWYTNMKKNTHLLIACMFFIHIWTSGSCISIRTA